MAELKPCPFCGSGDIGLWESHSRFTTWNNVHFVQCNACGATSDAFPSIEEAIKAWNRRTYDSNNL